MVEPRLARTRVGAGLFAVLVKDVDPTTAESPVCATKKGTVPLDMPEDSVIHRAKGTVPFFVAPPNPTQAAP
jgi:hypothetical protein